MKQYTVEITDEALAALTKRILTQLKSGDMLLNQVLYTDYKTVGSAVFHPDKKGLTNKGKEIMKLFKKYWIK